MTRAMTVAKYMQDSRLKSGDSYLSRAQLQKLLYYAQGWSLAWTGQALFSDEIQAGELGPVVSSVFHGEHAQYEVLNTNQRAIIDVVLAHYGSTPARKLIDQTHDEMPWKTTWADQCRQGGRNFPISKALMLREFTDQSMRNVGPNTPQLVSDKPSEDEIRALTDEITEEWSETLAILAK